MPTKHTEELPRPTIPLGGYARDERESAISSSLHTFDSKLKMMPGVTVPLRSMLVTAGRDEILISPVGTPEEASGVGDRLTTLVAPSLLHHLHLVDGVARYRPLSLWGPPGLPDKRPELAPMRIFGRDVWPYGAQLEYLLVEGAPLRNEVVFFHKASKTLYTADLFFNIHEPEGWLTPIAFRAMGIWKRFGMMRMWKRWVTDRTAFQASMDLMMDWDFERIVMAHGDTVTQGAKHLIMCALAERRLIR